MSVCATSGATTFLIDEVDEPILALPWRVYAYRGSELRAARPDDGGRVVLLHRELMAAPKGITVDHIHGEMLNNRRHNMRLCTNAQNLMRKHAYPKTASGFRGVYLQPSGRYYVIISTGSRNGKKFVGSFDTTEDAARAFDQAAIELRGEFALLNFPADNTY